MLTTASVLFSLSLPLLLHDYPLIEGQPDEIIRRVTPNEIDDLIGSSGTTIPNSLKRAICTFYIGATVKYLEARAEGNGSKGKFSFLCHISQRRVDHNSALLAIQTYVDQIIEGLNNSSPETAHSLSNAYNDLSTTADLPSLDDILSELRQFIVGTEIQVINSDNDQGEAQ
jgi:hypothetical protein